MIRQPWPWSSARPEPTTESRDLEAPDDLDVTDADRVDFLRDHPSALGHDIELLIGVQKVRRARPDLSDDEFTRLMAPLVTQRLGDRRIAHELYADLAALRPPPSPPPRRPRGRRKLTEEELRGRLVGAIGRAREGKGAGYRPTLEDVADGADVDPRTISRWLQRHPGLRALFD